VGVFSVMTEVARRGGGDEMVATRVYNLDGYLVCDLICPITSASFSRAPVIFGAGAQIDAPREPWPNSGVAWESLPRVAVLYVSSQAQAPRSPIVIGVIKNKSSAVETTTQEIDNSTTRTPQPDVNDASLSAKDARVIVRSTGDIDNIATKDFVVRSDKILLKTEVEPLKAPAIAEELVAAVAPLYDAVNSLLEFADSFPSIQDLILAAQSDPAAAGGVLVPAQISMKFNIKGVVQKPPPVPPTPVSIDISMPYTPYDGPSKVDDLDPEDFDSPRILISPRD
jgi:hypothetical protein